MRILITGGAGFIGSNLVEKLMERKRVKRDDIIVYDNLLLGKKKFIKKYLKEPNFRFVEADLLDLERLKKEMVGVDVVFHLAANSDIRKGTKNTQLDLTMNTLATYNVLEAMRFCRCSQIVFSSTSTVYGEVGGFIPESHGPLLPVSLYGASKLSCESLISAYSNLFDIRAVIFRFANVVGKNSTHGVIHDFIGQLRKHPDRLVFLGNGMQRKPYIEVKDLLEGVMSVVYSLQSAPKKTYIFNIGPEDDISVSEIGDKVIRRLGRGTKKVFSKNERGWPGDIPNYSLDTSKIRMLGWEPRYSSAKAIEKAVMAQCRQ